MRNARFGGNDLCVWSGQRSVGLPGAGAPRLSLHAAGPAWRQSRLGRLDTASDARGTAPDAAPSLMPGPVAFVRWPEVQRDGFVEVLQVNKSTAWVPAGWLRPWDGSRAVRAGCYEHWSGRSGLEGPAMWMYPPYPLLQFDSSWGLFRILKWGVIIAVVAQICCSLLPLQRLRGRGNGANHNAGAHFL
jgi:hypothetical protein